MALNREILNFRDGNQPFTTFIRHGDLNNITPDEEKKYSSQKAVEKQYNPFIPYINTKPYINEPYSNNPKEDNEPYPKTQVVNSSGQVPTMIKDWAPHPEFIYNNVGNNNKLIYKTKYLLINSGDRDINNIQNQFYMKITSENMLSKMNLLSKFKNVKEIKLEHCILPKYYLLQKQIVTIAQFPIVYPQINTILTTQILNVTPEIYSYIMQAPANGYIVNAAYNDVTISVILDIIENGKTQRTELQYNTRKGIIQICDELPDEWKYKLKRINYYQYLSTPLPTSIYYDNLEIQLISLIKTNEILEINFIDQLNPLQVYTYNNTNSIETYSIYTIDNTESTQLLPYIILRIPEIETENIMTNGHTFFSLIYPDNANIISNNNTVYTKIKGKKKYNDDKLGRLHTLTLILENLKGDTSYDKLLTINDNGKYGDENGYIRHPLYRPFQIQMIFKIKSLESIFDMEYY